MISNRSSPYPIFSASHTQEAGVFTLRVVDVFTPEFQTFNL